MSPKAISGHACAVKLTAYKITGFTIQMEQHQPETER